MFSTPPEKLLICLMTSLLVVYSASLCGVCPPGNYVAKQCTKTMSRVCKPCPSGRYMDEPNMSDKCFHCKACDGKELVSTPCNATHNTVCKCEPDHYYNGGLLVCMRCQKCGPGSGVVQECTTTTNTVCGICVPGETFSSVRNSKDACQACKRCQPGEVVMKNCTRRRNKECEVSLKQKLINQNKSKLSNNEVNNRSKDQNHRLKSDVTTNYGTLPASSPTVDPTETSSESKADLVREGKLRVEQIVMYVLVVLAVVVFLGLVMYCICSKKRGDQKRRTRHSSGITGASKQTKQSLVVKIEGNSRVSTMPLVNGPQADKMLRDVSYSLIDELSRLLNPEARWKRLAGRLQFTDIDVQNLNIKPDVATSQLLSAWGHLSGSTLGALYEATMTLGWDCEGRIIGKYMLQPSQ